MALACTVFVAGVLLVMLAQVVYAQGQGCAGARVIVEGREPSPFVPPDDAGKTLRIEPSATLKVRGENLPPGASVRLAVAGLGVDVSVDIGNLASGAVEVQVADYS